MLTRLATHYAVRERLDEGQAAVWGGDGERRAGRAEGRHAQRRADARRRAARRRAARRARRAPGWRAASTWCAAPTARGSRGTTRRSTRWSRRRCCATWRSRISAAAAASGPMGDAGALGGRGRTARWRRAARRSRTLWAGPRPCAEPTPPSAGGARRRALTPTSRGRARRARPPVSAGRRDVARMPLRHCGQRAPGRPFAPAMAR